jgi:hypothetical protein
VAFGTAKTRGLQSETDASLCGPKSDDSLWVLKRSILMRPSPKDCQVEGFESLACISDSSPLPGINKAV